MLIESLENKKIKEIIKLKNKKYRDEQKLFIVETAHLVEEALKANLLVSVYKLEDYEFSDEITSYDVTKAVMNKLTDLPNCKIIGICKKIEEKEIIGDKILLLDDVQDPGNIGTIIRSSLGFNVTTIILGTSCCDLYNDKVIRATQGALFNLNIIRKDLSLAIEELKEKSFTIYGTDVTNGVSASTIPKGKYALIVGNEGNGISPEIKKLVDKNIYIETNPKLESLNVSVATSIILYELNK